MEKVKSLVLCQNKEDYFFPYADSENIRLEGVYKETNSTILKDLYKVLRRIPILAWFCYAGWKHEKEYEKIVIFDSAFYPPMVYLLKKRYKCKIYLYVWNIIDSDYNKKLFRNVIEVKGKLPIYSFDPAECREYGFLYNSMVYSKKMKVPKNDVIYDLFFLGFEKGRGKEILELYKLFEKYGIKSNFYVIGNMESYGDISISGRRVPYSEYLDMISKSRTILDIVQKKQQGLTIRVMESLFFEKKLITTNKHVKEYDFYSTDNIFVLGEDDVNQLRSFIASPYVPVSSKIKERYDLEEWINFFKE